MLVTSWSGTKSAVEWGLRSQPLTGINGKQHMVHACDRQWSSTHNNSSFFFCYVRGSPCNYQENPLSLLAAVQTGLSICSYLIPQLQQDSNSAVPRRWHFGIKSYFFLWTTESPLSPRAQAVYKHSSHRDPVTLPWSLPLSWWILASGHFCHRSRWWLWLCLSIRRPILPYLEPQWSVHTWDFPGSTQQRNTREDRV